MNGIFISYRRGDSAGHAGRLCDHLRRTFPAASVFMDVDAVTAGADFVNAIDANLSDNAVVLAVIGPQWNTVTDVDGKRRIENPNDYVVRELSTALRRQANVIPVLVGGAKMPSTTSLPSVLEELSRRNAIEISDTRFAVDAERLCTVISRTLDIPKDDQPSSQRIEYGQFFSGAALAKARSKFRRAVWITYALSIPLYAWVVLFQRVSGQINFDREVPPLNLEFPCEEGKTDGCRFIELAFKWMADPDSIRTFNKITDAIGIALGLLLFGFWTLVNFKVLRGKNWARIAFVALGGFLVVSLFDVLLHRTLYIPQAALLALYIATMIFFYVWAVRIMFTEPVRRWFWRA